MDILGKDYEFTIKVAYFEGRGGGLMWRGHSLGMVGGGDLLKYRFSIGMYF